MLCEAKDVVEQIVLACSSAEGGASLVEGIKSVKDTYGQLIIAGRLFENPELAQQIVAATAGKLPEGVEMVMPGDHITINVKLITPIAMEEGLRFAIREGGRTVGSGVVKNIIE